MIQIDNTLVSLDVLERQFLCDLSHCKGICCVEGDSGAPLLEEEVGELEKALPVIWDDLAPKAQEIIKEKSGGKMAIEIYPDSQLGDKSSLIDSMLLGENVCTLADGAFYADYGVPDFGIVFGPFLFDSWEQVWKLVDSDWYKEQCGRKRLKDHRFQLDLR